MHFGPNIILLDILVDFRLTLVPSSIMAQMLKTSSMTAAESTLFQQHTKQWLEEVLETNLKRNGRPRYPGQPVSEDAEKSDESQTKVTVTEFQTEILQENEKRPFPRQMPILKIRVKSQSKYGNSTDFFIVKLLDDEADVDGVEDNFGKRELSFYTNAVPDLEAWITSRGRKMKLGIPKCYYGKYTKRPLAQSQTEPAEKEETLLLNEKSTLVLEDLTESGFSPVNSKEGLKREELRSALKEMAIIHAVSWAYQHVTGENLGEKYDLCENMEEFVEGFVEDIEASFPFLADYLNSDQVPEGKTLILPLENLKARATTVLRDLLTPPDPARAPSCLVHMDFWDQNILIKDMYATCGGIGFECRILDWQNIIIGSPTHDLSCLLFTSINPIYRSFNTTNLLEYYWKIFKDTSQSLKVPVPYTFDSLKEEYKKSKLLPLLVMMGSIGMILDKPDSTAKFIQIAKELVQTEILV